MLYRWDGEKWTPESLTLILTKIVNPFLFEINVSDKYTPTLPGFLNNSPVNMNDSITTEIDTPQGMGFTEGFMSITPSFLSQIFTLNTFSDSINIETEVI